MDDEATSNYRFEIRKLLMQDFPSINDNTFKAILNFKLCQAYPQFEGIDIKDISFYTGKYDLASLIWSMHGKVCRLNRSRLYSQPMTVSELIDYIKTRKAMLEESNNSMLLDFDIVDWLSRNRESLWYELAERMVPNFSTSSMKTAVIFKEW